MLFRAAVEMVRLMNLLWAFDDRDPVTGESLQGGRECWPDARRSESIREYSSIGRRARLSWQKSRQRSGQMQDKAAFMDRSHSESKITTINKRFLTERRESGQLSNFVDTTCT